MKDFFINNVDWLLSYFYKSKWILEILSLFFVFQAFLYSIDFSNIKEFTNSEVLALKLVFWVLILIVSFLLYIKTDFEYTQEDDYILTSIFSGAVFSKLIIRFAIFILCTVNLIIFFRSVKSAWGNVYFILPLYSALGLIVFEVFIQLINLFKHKK